MRLRECAPCFSHPLFVGNYIEDIVGCLHEKEKARITLNFQSPQIEYRNILVEFLQHFSENRNFKRTTLFLGIYLLDTFMDNHNIPLERLNKVSLTCLLLAAKVEERDSDIPKISEIKKLTNICISSGEYIALETLMLTFFDWNIMQPTAVTYIEIYFDAVITQDDFSNCRYLGELLFSDLKSMKHNASEITFDFLNLTLFDLQISLEPPSKLAAAIFAATRYKLALKTIWSYNLTRITGYPIKDLEYLISILFRLKTESESSSKNKDMNEETPDSGYLSSKLSESTEDEEDDDEELDDQNVDMINIFNNH